MLSSPLAPCGKIPQHGSPALASRKARQLRLLLGYWSHKNGVCQREKLSRFAVISLVQDLYVNGRYVNLAVWAPQYDAKMRLIVHSAR